MLLNLKWLARASRQPRPRARGRALELEVLEDSALPSGVLVVTTPSDAAMHTGPWPRNAVGQANADAAAGQSDTIASDPSLAGATITLAQAQLEPSGAESRSRGVPFRPTFLPRLRCFFSFRSRLLRKGLGLDQLFLKWACLP
jgi:hypothetical protein